MDLSYLSSLVELLRYKVRGNTVPDSKYRLKYLLLLSASNDRKSNLSTQTDKLVNCQLNWKEN